MKTKQSTKPFFTDEEVDMLNQLALGKKKKKSKKDLAVSE
jgi:hypothetical protein